MVPSHRTTSPRKEPTITPYRDRLNNGDYQPKPPAKPESTEQQPKTTPAK